MTARQFAEAVGTAYTTVMLWLKQGLIAGAELVESPIGDYWQIPRSSLQTFQKPTRGRPLKKIEGEGEAADLPAVTAAEMKAGDVVKTPAKSKTKKASKVETKAAAKRRATKKGN